tara:strand:- start:556 stop:774 length:219 start_codon:yes stop_codon:yes gene_type:complete
MKDFLMRKMLQKQLKGVPEDQQEKMMKLFTENPELFQKMAVEIKEEMGKGSDQMTAAMEVAKRHRDELKDLL